VSYLYETHLHTAEVSKCAYSKAADYISAYKEMGYTGIIVTDHFYRGYCALNRNLPWEVWVEQFCRGYENAKEEGYRQGLDVFFGWEESFDCFDDYLVYGLDKQWLLEHPEARRWTRGEQYKAVREAGGCVVQAHPFRQRDYVPKLVLSAGCVDAVEVVNGGNEASFDLLAYRYAKKIGKPMLTGTDIHDAESVIYEDAYGVYSEKKLKSIDDFVKMILNNSITGIKINNKFEDYDIDRAKLNIAGHPVEIRDAQDMVISNDWRKYV